MEDPKAKGHEQAGRRPVLVISDSRLTSLALALVVPLTSTDHGWEIHVPVGAAGRRSLAMCERIRSVSADRLSGRVGAVSYAELSEVRAMVRALVGR
jgi:mRNA interferase MazF